MNMTLTRQLKKLRKAASGAVVEVESADTHTKEEDEKGIPLDLNTNNPNMVLVGDGGSDPAAEEYLYLPPGQQAIVAPKSSPDEEPSMNNAIKAVANIKLQKAANGAGTQILYKGPEGASSRAPSHVNVYKPATPAPDYFNPAFGATAANPLGSLAGGYNPQNPTGGGGGTPGYDPGVGMEPAKANSTLSSAADLTNVLRDNPVSDMFGRGARNILGAASGLITERLQRAAGGAVPAGYHINAFGDTIYDGVTGMGSTQTDPYQQQQLDLARQQMNNSSAMQKQQLSAQQQYQNAQLDFNRQQLGAQQQYWTGGLEQQRYATDAQRAIAQMNIDAQNAQNAAQLQYNRERLALDKLLGDRQAASDEKRALTDQQRAAAEAQQLLMTRAGRQLIAPGGNTIPSMQPLIGRSIN